MSITEFVGIINQNPLKKGQNPHAKFLEITIEGGMDSICIVQSLFERTVVDFNEIGLQRGGGIRANGNF